MFAPIDHHLLLWSHHRLRSLHATHIPGDLNRVADLLSWQVLLRGEWRIHPPNGSADLESVRPGTGGPVCFVGIDPLPVVVLPDRGSPQHGRTGSQLAQGPTQVCVSPSVPHCTDTVQSQGRRGTAPACGPLLAQLDLVLGARAHGISSSLANSPEEGPPFAGKGTIWHPRPYLWNLHVWSLDATRRNLETFYQPW